MIYCERQIGDMCRMHAINAYFGKSLLNIQLFFELCDKYDALIPGLKSRNMDGFAESRNIIGYILDVLDNKYSVLIPIKSSKNSHKYVNISRYTEMLKNKEITNYFEFNKNHVWLNKLVNNIYYKVDSISGVYPSNPTFSNKNHGYIIVINNPLNEIKYHIKQVKNINSQIVSIKNDIIKNKYFEYELLFFNLFHCAKTLKLKNLNYIKMMKTLFKYIKLMRSSTYNEELFQIINELTLI